MLDFEPNWYDNWWWDRINRQFIVSFYDYESKMDVSEPLWVTSNRLRVYEQADKLLDIVQRGDAIARQKSVTHLLQMFYDLTRDMQIQFVNIITSWIHAKHFTDVIQVSPTLITDSMEFNSVKIAMNNAGFKIANPDTNTLDVIAKSVLVKNNRLFSRLDTDKKKSKPVDHQSPEQIRSERLLHLYFSDTDPKALSLFDKRHGLSDNKIRKTVFPFPSQAQGQGTNNPKPRKVNPFLLKRK